MTGLITISHPFQTVNDFHQRAGKRLGTLIHRLASKYPQLYKCCGVKRMLLAMSVAWALTGLAKEGNQAAFEHIDDALSPPTWMGCVSSPPGGCVMVEGVPFIITEEEPGIRRFLWDGFAIFIDHEGIENISQPFFDLADTHQWKAYSVIGEMNRENESYPKEEDKLLEKTPKSEEGKLLEMPKPTGERTNEAKRTCKTQKTKPTYKAEPTERAKPTDKAEPTERTKLTSKSKPTEETKETNINSERNKTVRTNEELTFFETETRVEEKARVEVDTEIKNYQELAEIEEFGYSYALADFVDTVLSMNLSTAEQMSVVLDKHCVEAKGEAQIMAIEQARRLHYCIERNKERQHNEMYGKPYNEFLNEPYNQLYKQKGTIRMGDTYTFNVQGDYVKGDKVMGNKYVGAAQKDGEAEEHLKNALSLLMDEQDTDGKPLFQTQAQWFAVYRILTDNYGWKDGALADFCRRINALGMEWRVICKVDDLKKVNQTAPFYKAYSEWEAQGNATAYTRQDQVARRFQEIMQEEMA